MRPPYPWRALSRRARYYCHDHTQAGAAAPPPLPPPPRPEIPFDNREVVDLDEEELLDDAAESAGSTMQAFLKAVRNRLQYELSPSFPAFENQWLLQEIKPRNWWLRA